MLRLEHHHDCTQLSFQETQAVRWFMNSNGQSSNVNAAISFAGEIVPHLLLKCIEAACRTYDGLRTRFSPDGAGCLERRVMPTDACPIEFIVSQLGDAIDDPAVSTEVAVFCDRPFAFEQENWLRVLLVHTRDGSSVIAVSLPHVIADASSIGLMISGIWRDYALLAQGETLIQVKPRYSLRDFVGSQRAWAETSDFKTRLDQLVDYAANGIALARSELPSTYAGSALKVRPSIAISRRLPEALNEGLEKLSRRLQTSLHMTLVAGAMLAQAGLFQRRHLCMRLPFSNRVHQGAHEIVGFLANDVPLFLSMDEGQDCSSFIRQVQRHSFSMMRFGAVPWAVLKERLQELSGPSATRSPFEDYLINVFPALEDIGSGSACHAKPFPLRFSGFTSNELKVWMQTVNARIVVSLRVGTEDKELAEQRYMPGLIRALSAMVERPHDSVGRIVDDICIPESITKARFSHRINTRPCPLPSPP